MAIMKWNRNLPTNPMDEFDRVLAEMGRIFGDLNAPETGGLFDRAISPPIDVMETQDDYVLTADLPGIERKDIELSIASNVLTLKGEKKEANKESKRRYFRQESWTGQFQRTLSLPNSIDPDKVRAEFRDGVLQVTIGKKEDIRPRQITVNAD